MDQLERPSEDDWTRRREWFESLFDSKTNDGAYIVSEQALGLLVDLQAVYCSGAFVACIIVACTIIETHIRDVEVGPDFDGGIQAAFETSQFAQRFEWLRTRRNRLVHFKETKPAAITVDMQYTERSTHETEARRAIELVVHVIFENPWT